MTDKVLRIVYLQADNVKRLKAVRIRPDKTLVRIEGKNAAGKSSVLDAIAAALGGGKWSPDKPIREGAKKAKVVVDLGEIVVERHWTPTRTYLDVTPKGGGPGSELPSPQAVLDKLMGDLTFDPLGFILMKPADQVAQLKRLAGLDFDAMDEQRDALFTKRTGVNRDGKAADARVGTPVSKPKSLEPVDTSKLASDYERDMQHNRDCDEVVRKANDAETQCSNAHARCESLCAQTTEAKQSCGQRESELKRLTDSCQQPQAELAKAEGRCATLRNDLQEIQQRVQKLQGELDNAEDTQRECRQRNEEIAHNAKNAGTEVIHAKEACRRFGEQLREAEAQHMVYEKALSQTKAKADAVKPIEVGSLADQMDHAKQLNEAIAAYQAYEQREAEACKLTAQAAELTEQIEKLDEQKQATLAAAKFPVKGLAFDADGVSFNGIPLSQASSAAQLRIGVAIGLAQKPRARIMLCRNGSLLDNDSLQQLHDIAEEFDAQVFVERVAEVGSPNAVFIEDGEVVDFNRDFDHTENDE